MSQLILYFIYISCTLTGIFLFKTNSGELVISFNKNGLASVLPYFVLLGIMFYVCSFLLWLVILKNNNISNVFPLLNGIVVALSTLGGVFLLKERIGLIQVIGIAFIVAGIILINIKK
jgi:drug/metabolite transporter (DMT)-like permease